MCIRRSTQLIIEKVDERPEFTALHSIFLIYCYESPDFVNYFKAVSKLLLIKNVESVFSIHEKLLCFLCYKDFFFKNMGQSAHSKRRKIGMLDHLRLFNMLNQLQNSFCHMCKLFNLAKSDIG